MTRILSHNLAFTDESYSRAVISSIFQGRTSLIVGWEMWHMSILKKLKPSLRELARRFV